MKQSAVKIYSPPPVDLKNVLRYAADTKPTAETEQLYKSCLEECLPKTVYKVCYRWVKISNGDFGINLDGMEIVSSDLKRRLDTCHRAVIFAATAGLDYDRLVARYGKTDTARAYVINAIGTERVEALCDLFCAELKKEALSLCESTVPRFSPGYGDLPLELQREIFAFLHPEDIGVYINGSLLMTPSKSVTAIVGIKKL